MADRDESGSTTRLVLFRLAVLVALAVSGALYAQYLNPADASFCAVGSGCDEVRRSAFAYFGSRYLSLPLVGLLGFASVLAASVQAPDSPWARRLALLGAGLAAVLLALQTFVLQVFCSLCVAVDVAAIAAGLLAYKPAVLRPRDPLRPWAWGVLGAALGLGALAWTAVKPSLPVPAGVRALYRPGAINVVEFADFECPFCRTLHPTLKRVMKDYPGVHFVRKHVPLESHEHARPAARAAVCAEEQGKGEVLADRLAAVELSTSTIRRAALDSGVDRTRLDACLATDRADDRIDADRRLLESAGMLGLPTTYVGGERLLGAVGEAKLRDAFERARRGESDGGVPAWLFVSLGACVLFAVAWLGRASRGKLEHERP